jgi:hypothetical protein
MSHMSDAASARHRCPECGAELPAGQTRCWLCERKVSGAADLNPYASPRPAMDHASVQFSLASLFLVTTLVAVFLGVFMLAPGLGILLAVFATPATIRTMIASNYKRSAGTPWTTAEKIAAFFVSLVIMVAIGFAAFVAFQVVCWSGALLTQGNETYPNILVGLSSGLVAAIVVLVWLWRVTRPYQDPKVLEQMTRIP